MFMPDDSRYDKMIYRRAGKSGLQLPVISLGMWQNFGLHSSFPTAEEMVWTAFNHGIVHFDLANNYGNPAPGSAEETFGRILARGLGKFRDELCISTKAGYDMWRGPYGSRNSSRKYLTASLDQSLLRMGLDYVDIFYVHCHNANTPAEETALALDNAVRQGKALYVGISNYNREQTAEICAIFKELRTPFVLNQPMYSMLNRGIEYDGLVSLAEQEGFGFAAYCPLHQGILTDKYLGGIPEHVLRSGRNTEWLSRELTDRTLDKLNRLNEIAQSRGQKLSQMALAWVLSNPKVTTVLIGASRPEQILENVQTVENLTFPAEELARIESILAE